MKFSKGAIGILGGSFDPPHKGHLKISNIAIKKLNIKKLYWLITKKNPFKRKPYFSLKERILKSRNIVKKNKKIEVLYLDNIVKSSRTLNVVLHIIKKKKIKNIYLVLGSDNLINFHKWTKWKKLVELTKLVVFSRKGYDKKSKKTIVVKYLKKNIVYINNKTINISSSKIRKKIKKISRWK